MPGATLEDATLLYGLFGFVFLIDVLNFLAWCGFESPRNLLRKVSCVKRGWQHLLFSNAQKFKPAAVGTDPALLSWPEPPKASGKDEMKEIWVNRRRLILIRHGESEWNKVFNRGIDKGKTLIRIFLYPILELLKFPLPDSYFYDSPLSDLGIEQCNELAAFVAKTEDADMGQGSDWTRDARDLRGMSGTRSIVVCSQLRRAISTAVFGLWPRLKRTGENVLLLSSLMEQSRNFDCVPLSAPQEVPPLHDLEALREDGYDRSMFDPAGNMGDKPVKCPTKERGYRRMLDFVEFCFQPNLERTTIIAVGHSLYFRNFFRCFLDHSLMDKSPACVYKLKNAAAVGITLQRQLDSSKRSYVYRIMPDEIDQLHPTKNVFKK